MSIYNNMKMNKNVKGIKDMSVYKYMKKLKRLKGLSAYKEWKKETLKGKGVCNTEKKHAYNMEKKYFGNIKSLNLREETLAKLNSIIEKEQQKQKMN